MRVKGLRTSHASILTRRILLEVQKAGTTISTI
jgi:hypothetical protein